MVAGAGLVSGIGFCSIAVQAAYCMDIVLGIYIIQPELSEWYESGRLPLKTLIMAGSSAGLATLFIMQGASQKTKAR
jgi:hypothetical protein